MNLYETCLCSLNLAGNNLRVVATVKRQKKEMDDDEITTWIYFWCLLLWHNRNCTPCIVAYVADY